MSKKKSDGRNSAIRKKRVRDRRAGVKANSHYKDTVFRMLFRGKKELLELYNALKWDSTVLGA